MKARKHLEVRLPHFRIPLWWPDLPGNWRAWLPSRGNVLFTLLVVGSLLWASSAGALPIGRVANSPLQTTTTIAYQGRLADSAGNPLTGTFNMIFRLYDVPTGGAPLWTEQWTGSNGVRVSDGLFNVMLGSLEPIPQSVITGHDQLWLGITVGTDDEMQPRVQLGSVPFAVQALTVPDGSITTAKIVDGAVTQAKLSAHAQIYHAVHNWSWSTDSTTWTRVGNLAVTFTVEQESVLIMTANGHVNSDDADNPWLYASFFVDGVHPVNEQAPWGREHYLGSYHIYEDNTNGGWAPWSFTQLAVVGPGSHTVEVRAMVSGGTWRINGAATDYPTVFI